MNPIQKLQLNLKPYLKQIKYMNKGMQYAYLTEKERHILQPLLCKFQTLAPNMFGASYFIHYLSIKVIHAASEFHSIYK